MRMEVRGEMILPPRGADIFLNPDLTPETIELTSGWDCIDEFAGVLYYEISSGPLLRTTSFYKREVANEILNMV